MTASATAIEFILSVEDLPDTSAAVVGSLKDEGIPVIEVKTVQEATEQVARRSFKLILLDARVPDRDTLEVDAGIKFIQRLKSREFGEHNIRTPFLVLTSFVHEVDVDELSELPGFLGVLSKTAVTTDVVRELIGLQVSLDTEPKGDEFIVEDLLVSERGDNGDGTVSFTVPAWPGDDEIIVPIKTLPEDIAVELGWGDLPFFLWGQVNIAAQEAGAVRPRRFRLYVGSDEGIRAFENGGE
jgi:CheY-like chemotaxis protein